MTSEAALGFRVKSGWAMAVLLAGPTSAPRVIDRRRVELADPAVPNSVQPFHAGLDLPKAAAAKTVGRLVKGVERSASRSLEVLLKLYSTDGHRVTAAAIVVGSTISPEAIKNDHIRAHAEEGRLFRAVIEAALRKSRVRVEITPEKELLARGAKALRIPESGLRAELTTIGKALHGPWRAEEKAATLAAWMALASSVG